ncbi:MAG TPA: DUF4142 domain-containing protein [Blastocatellia bacterium]
MSVPTDLQPADKASLDRLGRLSGPAFDRQYMQLMVSDHRKDVAEFEREAARARDPQLKDWVVKTLPTLKSHLAQATSTLGKLNGR